MLRSVYNRLLFLLLLLVGTTVCGFYFLLKEIYPVAVLFGLLVLGLVFFLIRLYLYNTRKITFLLNAIESGDYNFQFTDHGRKSYDNFFNLTLNRIKELLLAARNEAIEQEKYYELILSNVITGIVVINEKGNIFQTNEEALRLLDVPILTHINQLARVDNELPQVMLSLKAGDSHSMTLQNERGTTNLSLQASGVNIRGNRLRIIAINDIDRQLDEKELESWTRLTRVLTHEIMNAITPITSLTETLLQMYDEVDDHSDVKHALEVINTTSKGLMAFVESYRNFTRIPLPQMKLLYIKPLLERLSLLAMEDSKASDIQILVDVSSEDLMVQADENQISQVILNLLKNAVAALTGQPEGIIKVSAYCNESEFVIIEVYNNGTPIPEDVAEHIFVPFFTTKSNGSGVGLSISRQIMRLHHGSIKLKYSDQRGTAFVLTFR